MNKIKNKEERAQLIKEETALLRIDRIVRQETALRMLDMIAFEKSLLQQILGEIDQSIRKGKRLFDVEIDNLDSKIKE